MQIDMARLEERHEASFQQMETTNQQLNAQLRETQERLRETQERLRETEEREVELRAHLQYKEFRIQQKSADVSRLQRKLQVDAVCCKHY